MPEPVYNFFVEAALFDNLAKGNERSFEAIYRHFSRKLFTFVSKLLKIPELAEKVNTTNIQVKISPPVKSIIRNSIPPAFPLRSISSVFSLRFYLNSCPIRIFNIQCPGIRHSSSPDDNLKHVTLVTGMF